MALKPSDASLLMFAIASMEATVGAFREVMGEHLFLAILKLPEAEEKMLGELAELAGADLEGAGPEIAETDALLETAGCDKRTARRRLRRAMKADLDAHGPFSGHRSKHCRALCAQAEAHAAQAGADAVRIEDFLWSLMADAGGRIRDALLSGSGAWQSLVQRVGAAGPPAEPGAPMAHAGRGGAPEAQRGPSQTPTLDRFGRDLTALARAGKLSRCIGRRDEMRAIARILSCATKSNPVLVGEPGVGKTCIVEGLANIVVGPGAPGVLSNWRIVEVSMATIIAGCSLQGQLEKRLNDIVAEACAGPDLIVFMDELHTLAGAGGAQGKGLDAAQVLKPALARGQLRLIGATTAAEYREYIEPDAALERRLQPVWVDEPGPEEALEIVRGAAGDLAENRGIAVAPEAVEKAVEWSRRYLPDHFLPDKAIDLIDQACAAKLVATLSRSGRRMGPDGAAADTRALATVTIEDVAEVLSARCRVPVGALTEDEGAALLELEAKLARHVKGQDEAIQVVADAIRMARAGLKRPGRPMGVFLFLGPTGVGKTALARALAACLFGGEDALLRFDMSEYSAAHDVARLTGAPPGYVGHEEEGQLTGAVRRRPYGVLLFDEVEKAHAGVYDLFLQIFDAGRLTDARGRTAYFHGCIIVLTSNLGGAQPRRRPIGLHKSLPEGAEDAAGTEAEGALEAARAAFRPEILNRIDHQIVFHPLTREVAGAILDGFVESLNERLAERKAWVRLSDAARQALLEEGFSRAYGARELERVFERYVSTPLSRMIIERRVKEGAYVDVDVQGGEWAFRTC